MGWTVKRNQNLKDLPIRLQEDMEALQIDLIALLINLEIEAGYTERAIAISQVLI